MNMEDFECPCRQPFGDSDDEELFVFETDLECKLRHEEESLERYEIMLHNKTLQEQKLLQDIKDIQTSVAQAVEKVTLLRVSVLQEKNNQRCAGGNV